MNLGLRTSWRSSTLGRSARVLTKSDQKKTLGLVGLQIFLGVFDLLGVAAIGILGALAVSGVKSGSNGSKVEWVLEGLNLDGLTFQQQTAALGVISVGLLVTRTVLSVLVSRKILYFLSSRGSRISSILVAKLLSESLLVVETITCMSWPSMLQSAGNSPLVYPRKMAEHCGISVDQIFWWANPDCRQVLENLPQPMNRCCNGIGSDTRSSHV